jgi:hypothetical protein
VIVYLATRGHRNMMREYLDSWGRALRGVVVPLAYEDVFHCRTLRAATYVFADVDRLAPADAARAARLWEALAARPEGVGLLNHPTRSRRRYELLRRLHAAGTNRFNVYRATEGRVSCRFPVFLRGEHDHAGRRTGLLPDQRALDDALAALARERSTLEDVLITEFCDTADRRGVYRKYSAFVIGTRLVAAHVFYGTDWLVKSPQLAAPAMVAEEYGYVTANPHEAELREIFRRARIEYGRIDYAMLDGVPQVWEINTNPWIMSFRDGGGRARHATQARVAAQVDAAFAALAGARRARRLRVPVQAGPLSHWMRPWPRQLVRAVMRRTGLIWREEALRGALAWLRGAQAVPADGASRS